MCFLTWGRSVNLYEPFITLRYWASKSMIFMVQSEKMFSSWKKTPVFSGCWTHSTVSTKVTGHSYEMEEALMDPAPGVTVSRDSGHRYG